MVRLFPVLLLLAGCPKNENTAPPLDRFYFPAGIVHVDVPGKTEGVLFVANANGDKRYSTGSLVALALDSVGLPAIGTRLLPDGGVNDAVVDLKTITIDPSQAVQIASFASELSLQEVGPGSYRLYTPTRSEGMNVYRTQATIDAQGIPSLKCIPEGSQDCTTTGLSMVPTDFDGVDAGVQWALTPQGITNAPRACTVATDCCNDGATDCMRTCPAGTCVGTDNLPFADVWVSFAGRGDAAQLLGPGRALYGYLARLDSDQFTLGANNLINIGPGASNSVTVVGDWVYTTGRIQQPAPNLMRLVSRDRVVLSTALESLFRVSDSRSLALSSDGKRMFIVGRAPDTLLIANIDQSGGLPALNFVRGVSLPDAPNEVRVIARPGQGDLVVVSCTSAGSVVVYDDDVGDLVSLVGSVGSRPYGLAVDERGTAARIYVSNYNDGRIAVIDIADLNRPQDARLVAHLGEQQVCLTLGPTSPNCLASQEGTQ